MDTIPPVNGASESAGSAAPEPLNATTLSASLTVDVIEASLDWYRDMLGFTVTRTFEREGKLFAVSLRAGAVPFLLTQDNGERGTGRLKGEGISLRLTTSQNVDDLATRVKQQGWKLETEPFDFMGARAFRLRDPDGFKLVISSEV